MKLPKPYLYEKPIEGTPVVVCSDPRRHYKAWVVEDTLPDDEVVRVVSIDGSKEEDVCWRLCKPAKGKRMRL